MAIRCIVGFWLVGMLVGCSPSKSGDSDAVDSVAIAGGASNVSGESQWLLVGGGAVPELNQISLEEDLRELSLLLGNRVVRSLFGGGSASRAIQVLQPGSPSDLLRAELGMFFAPRGGRDSTYRAARSGIDGPATRERVLRELEILVKEGNGLPSVYVATHGEKGETAAQNRILLWGDGGLTVSELAGRMDAIPGEKPLRAVVTACYSGGFADWVFKGGNPAAGVASRTRCGFFASTADRVSSGCDPNPDRRVHQGYGVHFLKALSPGDGDPTHAERHDWDRDGRVSLADAHTSVRIHSLSLDIPVRTSERWLEVAFPEPGIPNLEFDPHEAAVIRALGRPNDSFESVTSRALRAQQLIEQVETQLQDAEFGELEAYRAAAADVLNQWPVLDDPWHPEFEMTLQQDRDEIAAHLQSSVSYQEYLRAAQQRDAATARWERAMVQSARIARLYNAYAYLGRIDRLKKDSAELQAEYDRIRSCENSVL